MKVGSGLGDCPTEGLWQMWSSNNELGLRVNRAQCYREGEEGSAEYMLVNVSGISNDQGRRGLWARFEHNGTLGSLNHII